MQKTLNQLSTLNPPYLEKLGAQITARRKVLKVRAKSCAGASNISRVTLHRIEKGEPSVSMGAYLQVCDALGLHLALLPPDSQESSEIRPNHNEDSDMSHIRIKDYPQLKALSWQLNKDGYLTDAEAMSIYERNKRFLDLDRIDDHEKALIQRLVKNNGMEQLLV
jgi:transcriptional regulator with XRE-family HTH domain